MLLNPHMSRLLDTRYKQLKLDRTDQPPRIDPTVSMSSATSTASSSTLSDFVLPGVQARSLLGQDLLRGMLAWAYSSRWNSRRLECHTYALWQKILDDPNYDFHPHLFVVSQFSLDTHNDNPINRDHSNARTISYKDADALTPDFSIVSLSLSHRPSSVHVPPADVPPLESWPSLQVTMMKTPLLLECKRPPTRHALNNAFFSTSLGVQMRDAVDDAIMQGYAAFFSQPHLAKVILMAVSGEWWRWRLLLRPATHERLRHDRRVAELQTGAPITDDADFDEYMEETRLSRSGKKCKKDKSDKAYRAGNPSTVRDAAPRAQPSRGVGRSALQKGYAEVEEPPVSIVDRVKYNPEPQDKRTASSFIHHHDLAEDDVQSIVDNPNDLLGEVRIGWSDFIRLGTPASNQSLGLIHRLLAKEHDRAVRLTCQIVFTQYLTDFQQLVHLGADSPPETDDESEQEIGNADEDADDNEDDVEEGDDDN